jgi:isochorismate synthase
VTLAPTTVPPTAAPPTTAPPSTAPPSTAPPTTATDAADLLAGYGPGSPFFFASPRGTLLTEGVHAAIPPAPDDARDGDDGLTRRVSATLDRARAAGVADPLVVGAVAFDTAAGARLAVPHRVRRAGRLPRGLPALPPAGGDAVVVPVPAPHVYADAVRRAVVRLRAGELQKVVLARTLRLTGDAPFDAAVLLHRLAARDPNGYLFAVGLDAGRTLVGASPELLVTRRGRTVLANPLAGSVPRHADPVEDRRRAEALLSSAKDLREHAVVVDAVAGALRPLCTDLDVPAAPELTSTASMWHLSTVVTGEVAGPEISALTLATALHPTPAVCGTPRSAARAAIADYEPFDRGYYTGMVGWGDARGDGEWVVTIRCAVAQGNTLELYAGAGIVADSDPEAELAETSAKFRTLLDGLGL